MNSEINEGAGVLVQDAEWSKMGFGLSTKVSKIG